MMIVMKFAFRLDIGLSFLLQCAQPLVTARRELIVARGLSDRTAIAGAAPRSRQRNLPRHTHGRQQEVRRSAGEGVP
jgi:hypothetical protein